MKYKIETDAKRYVSLNHKINFLRIILILFSYLQNFMFLQIHFTCTFLNIKLAFIQVFRLYLHFIANQYLTNNNSYPIDYK